MRRNTWYDRGNWKLYPNLFTVLVGRPGIGKGAALNPAVAILKEANTSNILSDRLTIEYVLETMAKGFPYTVRSATGGLAFGKDSSCLILAPELSVFLRNPRNELPDLADLWDCRPGEFLYGTRTKGSYKIKDPCPSILAGCAPDWLVDSVPPKAVGGGFTRRVNFVYAKEESQRLPWPPINGNNPIRTGLVEDLKRIGQLRGAFTWEKAAEPLFESYYRGAKPSEYDDEATANYLISRWAHATKLSMVISAARGDSMKITVNDLAEAIDAVDEVIDGVKTVFRSVGESDMATTADKVLRFLEFKGVASINDILSVCWKDCTKPELEVVLVTLRDGGVIAERQIANKTMYEARPQPTRRKTTVKGVRP